MSFEDENSSTSTVRLNRDIRRIFIGYFLQNTSNQLKFSYYDSRNENTYLIGETQVDNILNIYFLNKFWRDSTKHYLHSLNYKVVLESAGGRRIKYPAIGRLLTDNSSLKQSRVSQQFILLLWGGIAHAIKTTDLQLLFEFALLRPTASGLDYGPHSNSVLRHTPIPWEDWFSNLEELDFAPVFPPKSISILTRLLNRNIRTLKRLYLPNFVDPINFDLKRFELVHLKKCFMTCLVGVHPAEPIGSFLPYFALNVKTLEFSMNYLADCTELPPNIIFNPSIKNLELTFKSVVEPSNQQFWSWINSITKTSNQLDKLVFATQSLYIVNNGTQNPHHATLDFEFFSKNKDLFYFMAAFNEALISGKQRALPFKLLAEFDIRCHHEEIRSGLRVGGQLLTLQLLINAQNRHSGILIGFQRDQKLIKEMEALNYALDSTNDFVEQISIHWQRTMNPHY
ncbi:hypothetical protein M3Y97_00453000 [Aphelenchoides bicaudatus]|nr:hypothetical protein M3Y97_00453000 [Aphelenchoides bicaudatus]